MQLGSGAEPFHQRGFDSGVGDGVYVLRNGVYVLRKVDRGGNVAGTVKSSSSLNNELGGGVFRWHSQCALLVRERGRNGEMLLEGSEEDEREGEDYFGVMHGAVD